MQGKNLLSQLKLHSDYLRWKGDRYETWGEAIDEIADQHRTKYKDFDIEEELNFFKRYAYDKKVLASQRNLQWRGDDVFRHNSRLYNCSTTYVDRPEAFSQTMYLLLCGCGVGYSVERKYITKLPEIKQRSAATVTHLIADSIEGWADSIHALMMSYFEGGEAIRFDYSQIRPKNSLVAGKFLAPGPEPLKKSLEKIEQILDNAIGRQLTSLEVHDVVCHIADAVISAGLRRCLPKDSKVFLKDGIKNIQDVEEGDEVLTPFGYYKVLNNFYQGKQDTIIINTLNGKFECTPEHKMAVLTGVDEYKWVEAKDLSEGDLLVTNSFENEGTVCKLPDSDYERLEHDRTSVDISIPELTPELAFAMGVIHADGYIRYVENRTEYGYDCSSNVSVAFNGDDLSMAEFVKKALDKFGVEGRIRKRVGEHCYNLVYNGKQLAYYLHKHLKQPNTEIRIPDFIWNAPTDIKMAYLHGVFCADGAPNNKPVLLVTTVYEKFALDLQILCYSVGIKTRYSTNAGKNWSSRKGWKDLHTLALINNSDKQKFNSYSLFKEAKIKKKNHRADSYSNGIILANDSLSNKQKNALGAYSNSQVNVDNFRRLTGISPNLIPEKVISIEEGRRVETFDIEVEEVNQFYCNGLLTHNSALISIFDKDDHKMINCKTGNWYKDNPQRARANNSAKLIEGQYTREDYDFFFDKIKQFGEPGFLFVEDEGFSTNPCQPSWATVITKDGISTIGQIDVGDEIWSETGWTKVVRKVSRGVKEVAEFKTSWGVFIGTRDHKVIEEGKKVEVREARSIDYLLCPDGKTYYEGIEDHYEDMIASNHIWNIEDLGKHEVFDITVDNEPHTYWSGGLNVANCGEIGFIPVNPKTGNSCVSFCNLCEINAKGIDSEEEFLNRIKAAAIIGTLQSGYTDFPYLGKDTEELVAWEALLGISITGWWDNPSLFDEKLLQKGAEYAKEVNRELAEKLGINPSARLVCVKPSGNASTILECSSGIHPAHSRNYFRVMQLNKDNEVAKWLKENRPEMLEESRWSANNTDYVAYIPITEPAQAVVKSEVTAEEFLEKVKLVQQNWVLPAKNDRGYSDRVSHNVSNTVTVDDWDAVADYLYENREYFCGVSFLPDMGDKVYRQAPFTSVLMEDELLEKYGKGCMFASGLVVDLLHAFDDDLWDACEAIQDKSQFLSGNHLQVMQKKDLIRRAKKYADNYFDGNLDTVIECLKDVHLFHKWCTITRKSLDINVAEILGEPEHLALNNMAAVACHGGQCEI